jgi:hypothetical protein
VTEWYQLFEPSQTFALPCFWKRRDIWTRGRSDNDHVIWINNCLLSIIDRGVTHRSPVFNLQYMKHLAQNQYNLRPVVNSLIVCDSASLLNLIPLKKERVMGHWPRYWRRFPDYFLGRTLCVNLSKSGLLNFRDHIPSASAQRWFGIRQWVVIQIFLCSSVIGSHSTWELPFRWRSHSFLDFHETSLIIELWNWFTSLWVLICFIVRLDLLSTSQDNHTP